MFVKKYFEEFEVGESRVTTGRTITETDFVVHAGHTGDFYPHHMDAEWCKTQSFGQRIAHGTMIFSIGIGLTASFINEVAYSYGYDRLRFVKPVHIGDTIHTRVTIGEKNAETKHKNLGQVKEITEVINQNGDVVLACTHLLMVEKKNV